MGKMIHYFRKYGCGNHNQWKVSAVYHTTYKQITNVGLLEYLGPLHGGTCLSTWGDRVAELQVSLDYVSAS